MIKKAASVEGVLHLLVAVVRTLGSTVRKKHVKMPQFRFRVRNSEVCGKHNNFHLQEKKVM